MRLHRIASGVLPLSWLLSSPAAGLAPAQPADEIAVAFGAAQAPPLERFVELARQRAPRLRELAALVAAARERVEPAGALGDPMIEARLENMGLDRVTIGEEEMSRFEVAVRQALPYPGKREARREVARAEAERMLAELVAAEREVVLEVQETYARLYAADREIALLDAVHELLELLAATVTSRYSTGEVDQEAVLKVQLQISRHDQIREGVIQGREQLAAELRRALDFPVGLSVGRVDALDSAPLPAGDLAARAIDESPQVAVRGAAVAAAERRLAVERLELRPNFSVAAGLAYRGDLDPGIGLGLGIELPFWRKHRQEPLIRAAEHEFAAAREARRQGELAARGEAESLLAAWARLERRIRLSDEAILPQSAAAFDAARFAYLTARADFSTAVEDLGLWLEARVDRARLEAERFSTRAALLALLRLDSPNSEGSLP